MIEWFEFPAEVLWGRKYSIQASRTQEARLNDRIVSLKVNSSSGILSKIVGHTHMKYANKYPKAIMLVSKLY